MFICSPANMESKLRCRGFGSGGSAQEIGRGGEEGGGRELGVKRKGNRGDEERTGRNEGEEGNEGREGKGVALTWSPWLRSLMSAGFWPGGRLRTLQVWLLNIVSSTLTTSHPPARSAVVE